MDDGYIFKCKHCGWIQLGKADINGICVGCNQTFDLMRRTEIWCWNTTAHDDWRRANGLPVEKDYTDPWKDGI